ncbi:MAG: polysaccharide deacetylase family protein [Pyrinomonadaceae bacterium]|nr:polysaccharide deacetylase family protein [Pyrinomonadaceae bacterium]
MNSPKLFLTRSLKSLASLVKTRTGLPSPIVGGAVNIVAYHRVVADIAKAEREAIRGLVVSTETFRRHCELLQTAFEVVSLETAAPFLDGTRRVKRPLAVITFDDGYLDFYEVAFPILNELGLPAVNFLPTNFMGGGKILAHDRIFWLVKLAAEKRISIRAALEKAGIENAAKISGKRDSLAVCDALVHLPNARREKVISELERKIGESAFEYPREYQLLDWEQIGEMQGKGIDFGFHTANHVVLPLEDDAALETEIFAGKSELERRLNRKVVAFAYPNGAYNARIKNAVAKAGFEIAVTTERKINLPVKSDLLALGRISLCEESTRGLKGVYSPKVAALRLGV